MVKDVSTGNGEKLDPLISSTMGDIELKIERKEASVREKEG